MTLSDMTADPLNMIFLYHYQNHLYSIFYCDTHEIQGKSRELFGIS